MENASKALLIAGAVLIVILLIGIGMLIYSRSTGVVQTAAESMNSQEIQAFNSKFSPYEGTQKGSTVKTLMSTVIANNGSSANQVQVESTITTNQLTATATANSISTFSAGLNDSTNYSVSFEYSDKGLINKVKIAP